MDSSESDSASIATTAGTSKSILLSQSSTDHSQLRLIGTGRPSCNKLEIFKALKSQTDDVKFIEPAPELDKPEKFQSGVSLFGSKVSSSVISEESGTNIDEDLTNLVTSVQQSSKLLNDSLAVDRDVFPDLYPPVNTANDRPKMDSVVRSASGTSAAEANLLSEQLQHEDDTVSVLKATLKSMADKKSSDPKPLTRIGAKQEQTRKKNPSKAASLKSNTAVAGERSLLLYIICTCTSCF